MQKNEAHVRYSAQEYDHYTAEFVKPFDEMLAARVIEELQMRPEQALLLDVGAGTARFLVHLALLPELSHTRLVGTDIFQDMVNQANLTIEAAKLTHRIEMLVADVHAMPVADEYADIVLSRSTLHHWANPVQALREIDRILKPRGVAIIHDVRRDAAPEAVAAFNQLRASAGIAPSFLEEKFTAEEVRTFLKEAGLSDRAVVRAPTKGLRALGMAVEIRKPFA
jgi:ubiquinone/menaquinone biosynthesis C-methylase UbiE